MNEILEQTQEIIQHATNIHESCKSFFKSPLINDYTQELVNKLHTLEEKLKNLNNEHTFN